MSARAVHVVNPALAIHQAAWLLRFAGGVRSFIRDRLTPHDARAIVEQRLARRAERFLARVRDGVFRNARSPFRKLLAEAAIDEQRLETLVRREGIEGALTELRDRGVFVTYEEFRAVCAGESTYAEKFGRGVDFRNPLSVPDLIVRSSGSRSGGTRVYTDFGNLREVAVHRALYGAEFGFARSVRAGFFPILPSGAGLNVLLWGHYLDQPMEAWFTPTDPARAPLRYRLATRAALLALRARGGRTIRPRYVPLNDPEPVARWLADRKREGRTALLSGYPATCVRVCEAARELGLDIAGTGFCMVGEPITQAKHDVVCSVGAVPIVCYASVDAGFMANSCTRSRPPDEMHLFTDSFALIQHRRRLDRFDIEVAPFLVTTLLSHSPMMLLNVELDDYGAVEDRPCDCVWGQLGLRVRVSGIRSFVKLTSEGMTFVGSNVIDVIERELPSRFGGAPGDYQLLEEEDGVGRTRLTLRVRPRVGAIDEAKILGFVYRAVRAGDGARRLTGDIWEEAGALRVERVDPAQTAGGKVFAFHTLKSPVVKDSSMRPRRDEQWMTRPRHRILR